VTASTALSFDLAGTTNTMGAPFLARTLREKWVPRTQTVRPLVPRLKVGGQQSAFAKGRYQGPDVFEKPYYSGMEASCP